MHAKSSDWVVFLYLFVILSISEINSHILYMTARLLKNLEFVFLIHFEQTKMVFIVSLIIQ